MTTDRTNRVGRGVGLLGLAGGLVFGLAAAAPGPTAAALQPKPPADKPLKLEGRAVCQQCHGTEKPEKVNLFIETKGFDFVRLWENLVWERYDLHSAAYKNLTTGRTEKITGGKMNPTAERMENNLRPLRGESYTVAGDVRCLACHASSHEPLTRQTVENLTPASFRSDDGVGCEMCHGHGSLYRDEHQKSAPVKGKAGPGEPTRLVPWREWSPAVKQEWGLVDLRDPAVAAARCAGCHVGNEDEGRFVTHEMYAAGHPPLPPLDLLAYSREQPRHWGLASEMPYLQNLAAKDAGKAWAVFHYRNGESLVARRFAESAVATLAATAVLTGQLADKAGKDGGLDFAAFDCYACHHDLKTPSARQLRGYDGPPGRPLFRPAPFALARVVVGHAAGAEGGAGLKGADEELDGLRKRLALAFGVKTYGDPVAVRQASDTIVAWSKGVLPRLDQVRYTPAETRALLARVVDAATRPPGEAASPSLRPVADPEVAQLYAWAADTLLLELAGAPADTGKGPPRPPDAVTRLREQLNGVVVTRLRPEVPFDYEQTVTGGVPTPALESVDRRLPARSKTFNNFRPDPFRAAFQMIEIPR